MRSFTLLFSTIFLFASIITASSGDRHSTFTDCVSQCESKKCLPPTGPITLPLALRVTRWTCRDECRYVCMHSITDQAISAHEPVHQYYGKWPFWRFLGIQEPASVLFSLLNLWGHVHGFRRARRVIPKTHPMRKYYLGWGVVNVNAWIWSAVFHTRDMPSTEKLDYFSAGLAILYSLFYTAVRLFHLYTPLQQRLVISSKQSRPSTLDIWASLCILTYIIHVGYLSSLHRFDYTYNMAANLVIGILHNLLWITYSLPTPLTRPFPLRPSTYRPDHAYKAVTFAILTTMATTLELFDFPPWGRTIDAHALWHLSTAPIVLFWWRFLIDDALDEGWKAGKI
ncbi:Per1-like protein [Hysterangium stoloniferum]|nr:Per1-like protein [Hysterangium stoloniferum]